jgi:hypothetical protein
MIGQIPQIEKTSEAQRTRMNNLRKQIMLEQKLAEFVQTISKLEIEVRELVATPMEVIQHEPLYWGTPSDEYMAELVKQR